MNERRVSFKLGVTYDTKYELLREIPGIVEECVSARESVRFDRCHFLEFGDSALLFDTVFVMLVPDYATYAETRQAINLDIFRRFEAKGIEFAFPTRTVILGGGREEGSRPAPG